MTVQPTLVLLTGAPNAVRVRYVGLPPGFRARAVAIRGLREQTDTPSQARDWQPWPDGIRVTANHPRALRLSAVLIAMLVLGPAQPLVRAGQATPPSGPKAAEPAQDPLGRRTPRGTVLGFLSAARDGDDDLARHYLNTTVASADAAELAHQLYVVLDTRLPPRLTQIDDTPEGSRANPRALNEERIGTIQGPDGAFDVIVERVSRPKGDQLWLFSEKTLGAIPEAFADVEQSRRTMLPGFLRERRVGGVRLSEWLVLVLGLTAFYVLTVLLNRALTPLARLAGRRLLPQGNLSRSNALPAPVRVLLVSLAARWLITALPLSLLVRQIFQNVAIVATIISVAWLLVLLGGVFERALTRRIPLSNFAATVSLLRVGRRLVDMIVVAIGVLAILRHFGVDPTPLLAGLGVGGLAVALAAQKTLENVIAGASLIFDQAVQVGDYLKVGTMEGTVERIGLRSTRIRTLDRTVVSVPNSQIANMSVETFTARDKFWFHPVVGLRYETTSEQMRLVLDGIRQMLARQSEIDGASIRVRFLRLAASSLDVETFAYVYARDWPHFLEIQEGLLLKITEIVTAAGTGIAFPSQTMYVESVNSATPPLPIPK